MSSRCRAGFTLIEILIVVVILAILAATVISQFTDASTDARTSTALFNLNTLRSHIELFKVQHGGTLPGATLADLTSATVHSGKTYGPYMGALPENSITGSTAIKTSAGVTIVVGDITAGDGGGWVYSPATGEIRLDHVDFWER